MIRQVRQLARTTLLVSVAALTIASCSSESEESTGESVITEDDLGSETNDSTKSTAVVIDPEPVIGNIDSGQLVESTNSIGRTFMDSERVELSWTEVDDAINYQIYRTPTDEANFNTLPDGDLGTAEIIYEGTDLDFTDTSATPDTFITYFVIAETQDGSFTTPRWTQALTTADTEPPSDITGLSAEITDQGVLLNWDPSSDNLEFSNYNVTYISPEGVSDYLGGGGDIGQTSFIDANPRTGENLYRVTASDFHENVSDATEIIVTWPG